MNKTCNHCETTFTFTKKDIVKKLKHKKGYKLEEPLKQYYTEIGSATRWCITSSFITIKPVYDTYVKCPACQTKATLLTIEDPRLKVPAVGYNLIVHYNDEYWRLTKRTDEEVKKE